MHPDSQTAEQARDAALERLSEAPELLREMHQLIDRVRSIAQASIEPARMVPVRLGAIANGGKSVQKHDNSDASASIALYNPSTVVVYIGVGGGAARPGNNALSVPPGSLAVFPISAGELEVGAAEADLAAGDAVVFLFRFKTVQPAFFGAI